MRMIRITSLTIRMKSSHHTHNPQHLNVIVDLAKPVSEFTTINET